MWTNTHKVNVDGGEHLKSLKALVRQRECLEGSMVYQTMVYITQYLPKIFSSINVDHIWDVNSFKKIQREHLLGKGRMMKVKGN